MSNNHLYWVEFYKDGSWHRVVPAYSWRDFVSLVLNYALSGQNLTEITVDYSKSISYNRFKIKYVYLKVF